jgi:hypothetical protein
VESSCINGSENAAVLPVPVCAQPSTSRPVKTSGIACAWMGVGRVYPSSASARVRASMRPSEAKVTSVGAGVAGVATGDGGVETEGTM